MHEHIKTVAVTGATGFVGRTIVRALVEKGYKVRALCRDHEKARVTLPLRREVQLVVGEVHDDVSADAVCAGADAVIHLIGIIRPGGKGQTFERMHTGATQVIVDAATRAGAKRFVHMSALGVTIDGKAEYQRTKASAEMVVRRSGLDWTVFRPGLIHGPEGELTQQIAGWCTGDKQPWILIPYFARMVEHDEGVILGRVTFEPAQVAPVSVDCVAACFVEALARPATVGEVYNVVGSEELSFKQMLAFYRDGMPLGEKTLPIAPVPGPAAVVQAKIAKALGFGNFLPFDEGMAHMATQDATASLDKLKAHMGITPAGFRETAGRYVAAL
ncbi:MAG: NAD(P)H-binding protein [Phycisphaerales bacterium]